MITKKQAIEAAEFHFGACQRTEGPRGGLKEKTETWRRNGATQLWKTRPEDYRVPVKWGTLRGYGQIRPADAAGFHTAEDCPLADPAYRSDFSKNPSAAARTVRAERG